MKQDPYAYHNETNIGKSSKVMILTIIMNDKEW